MTGNAAIAPATPHRFEALDGLRGVCALCVCLFHFRATGPITALDFIRGSWLFVDFFFVLSGFVIASSYRERLASPRFLPTFAILRLGRIYPLHIVMLLAFVLTELAAKLLAGAGVMQRAAFDASHSVPAIFTNLGLAQAFGLHGQLTWNQPAWSIAVEFWTYLLFALAVRQAGADLYKWLVATAFAAVGVLAVATPNGINVSHDWSLFRCIYGVAVGALLWRLWQRLGRRPSTSTPTSGSTLVELAGMSIVVVFVAHAGALRLTLLAPLVFGGALWIFAHEAGLVSSALRTTPLRWLGLLSYSIYMVHSFVQARFEDGLRLLGHGLGVRLTSLVELRPGEFVEMAGADSVQGAVLTLVMLGLVVAISGVTWRFVELPGQRLARRLAANRSAMPLPLTREANRGST